MKGCGQRFLYSQDKTHQEEWCVHELQYTHHKTSSLTTVTMQTKHKCFYVFSDLSLSHKLTRDRSIHCSLSYVHVHTPTRTRVRTHACVYAHNATHTQRKLISLSIPLPPRKLGFRRRLYTVLVQRYSR